MGRLGIVDTRPRTKGPLVDSFGRVADDLRISVTDRCNFRCTYCMPAEGVAWLPRSEILRFEELAHLLGIFVGLGVRSLKITGGEPTVRADLPVLARMFREAGPELDISITTNGVLLDRLAAPLADAGVDRATVSCDSLLRHRFAEMTRRDALERVFAGLRAAERAGLMPIKINCVVIGGTNDDEVVEFARWSRETGYEVRFIEYMPLDAEHAWERAKVVPSIDVLERIAAAVRAQARLASPFAVPPQLASEAGLSRAELDRLVEALGFRPLTLEGGETVFARPRHRRGTPRRPPVPEKKRRAMAGPAASPFAVLARLKAAP
jgi:cyclic pyranopterin phosphate synthase